MVTKKQGAGRVPRAWFDWFWRWLGWQVRTAVFSFLSDISGAWGRNRENWIVHMVLSDCSLLLHQTSSRYTPEMQLAGFCSLLSTCLQLQWKCYSRYICLFACSEGVSGDSQVWCGRVLLFHSCHCAIRGGIWQCRRCCCSSGSAQFEACWRLAHLAGLMAALFTGTGKACRPHSYCKLCDQLIVCVM